MFVPTCYRSRKNFQIVLITSFLVSFVFFVTVVALVVKIYQGEGFRRTVNIAFNITGLDTDFHSDQTMFNDLSDTGNGDYLDITTNLDIIPNPEILYDSAALGDKLIIAMNINNLDLNLLLLKTNTFVQPIGKYLKRTKFWSEYRTPSLNFSVSVGNTNPIKQLPAGQPNSSPFETFFPLVGDVNKYPFDNYTARFVILTMQDLPLNDHQNVPLGFYLTGALQGFRFAESSITSDTNSPSSTGRIQVDIIVKRSRTTIGFSVFVTVIMWLLSIMILTIAVDCLLRGREIAAPLLAFPVSALFALPALRSIQPGIPPVGTLSDVLGYYWNMAFVAASALIIGFCFLIRHRDNRRTKPAVRMNRIIQFNASPFLQRKYPFQASTAAATAAGKSTTQSYEPSSHDDLSTSNE